MRNFRCRGLSISADCMPPFQNRQGSHDGDSGGGSWKSRYNRTHHRSLMFRVAVCYTRDLMPDSSPCFLNREVEDAESQLSHDSG